MYRFRKENWVRKVDSSYPKYWTKSSREYGFFMDQPRHMAESQYMETHSDRVKRSPYTAQTLPRAHMSVADRAPRKRLRKLRQRVGVYYDYDNGNDMWDVLRHRENHPTGARRRMPRSLSPIGRRSTRPPTAKGSSEKAQPDLVENPWFPMMRTNTATDRGFGRVAHSRHGYQVDGGRGGGEWESAVSPVETEGHPGHATDYNRAKTPKVGIRNGLQGISQREAGSTRGALNREPTGLNINSRPKTPGLSREYTLGPRLHTMGPREYHGLPEPGNQTKKRPEVPLEEDWIDTAAIRRGRSLSPVGGRQRNYSAARSRPGSPTMRNRKETLNERFFRFNFHEPWNKSIRTSSKVI